MPTTTVSFQNAHGESLSGRLVLPDTRRAHAYALFAHCFTCTKNFAATRNVAAALAERGIATLVFDFTGLGNSEGEFADSNFSTNVDDLVAAARYLETEHGTPTLLVGHSLGGTAVLKAAGSLPEVRAVATIGSPSHAGHVEHLVAKDAGKIEREGEAEVLLAGRPFTVKKQFLDDIRQSPVLDDVASLRKALLVLHAPLDDTVEISNATDLFIKAHHPKSFVSLDDADHLLSNADHSRYAGHVIATWAEKYIGTAPAGIEAVPGATVARTGSDGFTTEVNAAGHVFYADEPASVGGNDVGPAPYDLLSAALATCTTMTLKMYADRKKWPLEASTVTVWHEKIHAKDCADCSSDENARVDVFERELKVEGDLDDAQRARLLEIADRCPVHRTLHGEVKVRTSLADN
ncbi:MAG: bifunctional alpha/beta hydrolase/OsmC family protein [Pseudomonadota bacterium]